MEKCDILCLFSLMAAVIVSVVLILFVCCWCFILNLSLSLSIHFRGEGVLDINAKMRCDTRQQKQLQLCRMSINCHQVHQSSDFN